MQSSSSFYLNKLDHLRFVAALLVLNWHALHAVPMVPYTHEAPLWFLSIFEEGHTGVSLFMVISGFIFFLTCQGRDIVYGAFVRNRLLRIAPLYVVAILYYLFVQDIDPVRLAVAAFGLLDKQIAPGPTWTIAVEFQFYLIFPFLMLFLKRYGIRYLLALLGLALLIRLATWIKQDTVQMLSYWTIFGRIDQFLLGMIAGYVYTHHRHWLQRGWVAGLVLLAWLFFFHRFDDLGGFYGRGGYPSPWGLWVVFPTLEGLAYSWLVAAYVASSFEWRPRIDRALNWLGTCSYSMYLSHMLVVEALFALLKNLGFAPAGFWQGMAFAFLLCLPVIAAVASLSYWVIERPFLSLRRSHFRDAAPGA